MNYNESLRDIDWDENMSLPIANAENKLLEETIAKKLIERNRVQKELTENSAKANALKDHVKNVRDELVSAQVRHFSSCLNLIFLSDCVIGYDGFISFLLEIVGG